MTVLNLKIKKRLICYLIFSLCSLSCVLSPSAMMENEESHVPWTINVILHEDVLHEPQRGGHQNLHTGSPYSSRSAHLSGMAGFQNSHEESPDTSLLNNLSNSYVNAFQKKVDDRLTRSEFLRYLVCFVGGIIPFIPQIAISKTIADGYDSEFLGYALITASALSIEAITSWMIWELIDDTQSLVKLSKQNKRYHSAFDSNLCKSIGIGVSSLVLGVLSSAPDVYVKYKYNDVKFFALISLIYDSLPRIIGFYKIFLLSDLEKIRKALTRPSDEENLATRISDISKAHFLKKCKAEGVNRVAETLDGLNSSKEIYAYLTSDERIDYALEKSPQDWAKGAPRKGVKCLSLFPPIASALFNTAMAYKGFKLILSDETALIFLSAFSVMPAFILSAYIVAEASGNVFDKAYLYKSRTTSTDYLSAFYPKTNAILLACSLLLASATSFTSFNIIADNLDDTILMPLKYEIATLAIWTDFTFGTYTIYSTFKRYGELIYRKSSGKASYAINCIKRVEDFKSALSSLSSPILSEFIRETILEEEINP